MALSSLYYYHYFTLSARLIKNTSFFLHLLILSNGIRTAVKYQCYLIWVFMWQYTEHMCWPPTVNFYSNFISDLLYKPVKTPPAKWMNKYIIKEHVPKIQLLLKTNPSKSFNLYFFPSRCYFLTSVNFLRSLLSIYAEAGLLMSFKNYIV